MHIHTTSPHSPTPILSAMRYQLDLNLIYSVKFSTNLYMQAEINKMKKDIRKIELSALKTVI